MIPNCEHGRYEICKALLRNVSWTDHQELKGEWEMTDIFIRLKAIYDFDWFYTADSSNYCCSGNAVITVVTKILPTDKIMVVITCFSVERNSLLKISQTSIWKVVT